MKEKNNIKTLSPLKDYINKYNSVIYDEIEDMIQLVGKKIKLKNTDLIGYIVTLWLPSDDRTTRKNHLWYIQWDNGNYGIVEEKDLIRIDS